MSFQIVAGTGFFYVKIQFNHQSHSELRLPFRAPWGLKEFDLSCVKFMTY